MDHYIGIDIAKASLQVYIPNGDIDLDVENSQKGLKRLLSKVRKLYGKEQDVVWIYELTGSYSSLTKRFCHEHSIRSFIVKPSQSASFAKTVQRRNKTDLVDARMLYRMHTIATAKEIAVPKYDARFDRLQGYIRYYKSIVRERITKTNQLGAALHRDDEPFILRRLRSKIKTLRKETMGTGYFLMMIGSESRQALVDRQKVVLSDRLI